MFLKKCTQAKKRKKRTKIETKLETEAKRLKAFNPVEKSLKLGPKSAWTKSAQKIPEGDFKWLLQTDSSSTSKFLQTDSSSTSKTGKTDSSSTSKLPKTGSKAPPLPAPTTPTLPAPAWLGAPLPLKRKGPGRK